LREIGRHEERQKGSELIKEAGSQSDGQTERDTGRQ
jgi:hypothetical protein